MFIGATTRSVQPTPQSEASARFAGDPNRDIAGLTDRAFAEAAMDSRVLAAARDAEARTLVLNEQPPLTGWLDQLVSTPEQGAYYKPVFEQGQVGVEARRYDDAGNIQQVAQLANRVPDIRTLAIRRGRISFSDEELDIAA